MKKNNFSAKSFNKLLYITLCAVIGVTLVANIYLILMLNTKSLEVSKNKYISKQNNKRIVALAGLEGSLTEMSLEDGRLEEYLPAEKEVSQILKDMEAMAVKNGLTFDAYQVGNKNSKSKAKPDGTQIEKSDGYNIFPFQLTLTGSYNSVDSAMKEMEGYKRLIEVKDVKYSKSTKTPGDVISAVLQVNAYLKK